MANQSDNPLFRQSTPISSALTNRVVFLESQNKSLRERVTALENIVKKNRTDYDAHLVYGGTAGACLSLLLIGAIAWLAFGGRF